MTNLRTMRLAVASPTPPETWLLQQTDDIQRVTYVADGVLFQRPVVDPGAFVDPTAVLMGGMIVESGCFVGPYAVVRLDEKPTPDPLIIGQGSNVQDGAVVHATTQSIGERVIVAHQAVVHGAVIEDDVTIYIQAVADGGGTVIGRGSFLHQGSYVGKGIRIAPRRYVAPGQKIISQAEADRLPAVTEALRALSEHVLTLNGAHVRRYLASGG